MTPGPGREEGRTRFSTAEWMRLAVLVALNLVFFQGAWWLAVFPPITLLAVALDLTLLVAWVRRRGLTRAELVAALTGIAAAMAVVGYFTAMARAPSPRLARLVLSVLPEALADRLIGSPLGVVTVWSLEYAILIGLGVAAMALAGLAVRLRSPRPDRPVPSS